MATVEKTFNPEETFAEVQPYLRTKSESVHARRLISAFLASQIQDSDCPNDPLFLLDVPGHNAKTKEIPSHIQGLRRKYLRAVQSHQVARSDYEDAAARLSSDLESKTAGTQVNGLAASKAAVNARLALLKQRRRYEKMRILMDYLENLRQRDPAESKYLSLEGLASDVPRIQSQRTGGTRQGQVPIRNEQGGLNAALIFQLEKAVLRAKAEAENEDRLLSETQYRFEEIKASKPTNARRLEALERSRSALVEWIDSELSRCGPNSRASGASPKLKITETRSVAELSKKVQEKYAEYLSVRDRCVRTVGVHDADEDGPSVRADPLGVVQSAQVEPRYNGTFEDIGYHLTFATQTHRAILAQRSYAGLALSKHSHATLQKIQQFTEQSALLKADPLGEDSAELTLSEAPSSEKQHSRSGEETFELASTWSLAATKADQALHTEVLGHVREGLKNLEASSELIQNLTDRTIGSEPSKAGDEAGDVWTEEANRGLKGKGRLQQKARKKTRKDSVWQQLHGKMGAIGDGV
ncbi:MAG: hypothetical protein M1814_005874 [Vezdaea aestivalis]|nr:MAG: hypothetical protein M1814_005874 [Vezdaea aestivalis]